MRWRLPFGVLLALLVVPATGTSSPSNQSTIEEDPYFLIAPIQKYPLKDGGFLLNYQYAGHIDRMDSRGNLAATVKTERTAESRSATILVLTPDQARVALLFAQTRPRKRHRVIVLNAMTLQTELTLSIGPCGDGGNSQAQVTGNTVTLLCEGSRNPSDPKAKPELALVDLDTSTGRVVRWWSIGGTSLGSLPGSSYEASAIAALFSDAPCPTLVPTVRLHETLLTVKSTSALARAFIVVRRNKQRRSGYDTWDAWFDSGLNEPPRRSGVAFERTGRAPIVCWTEAGESKRRLLHVVVERGGPGTTVEPRVFRDAKQRTVVVIDVATGEVLTPESSVQREQ